MPHETALLSTVAVGLVLAFALGFLANRLRLPPLVGYLAAGIAVGPYTPGFVADAALAAQLAEIGVILLMFGVGLHFSAADLMAVRWIAIPGAVGQIAVATAIGAAMAALWGWPLAAGLVFGLALSVASTVVLLRALEERNVLETANGRIAVGWLIVEDLAMVLTLVLLPALAELLVEGGAAGDGASAGGSVLIALGMTIGKVVLFVAIAMMIGPRVVPWLLAQVARTGSRELFTLSVLAIALGIAFGAAEIFGVSFALGAFFAGLVLSESDLSHQAAADSLPLQDAFAVLFFVSVGMVFDPWVVVREPLAVFSVLILIMFGKSLAAFAIVLILGYPVPTALVVSASLAQIGEFSFILAGLGIALGMLPVEGRDLILAGALLSISLNPLAFAAVEPLAGWFRTRPRMAARIVRGEGAQLTVLERELADAKRLAEERRVGLQTQEIVSRFPMFAELDGSQQAELLTLFKPRSAVPGERLIRTGDVADSVFFISSGAVEVSVAGQRIRLGPGDFFGEMGLLNGGRRTADVTAIDYCQFLTLDQRDFMPFISKHPTLHAMLGAVAAQRNEMNRRQQLQTPGVDAEL